MPSEEKVATPPIAASVVVPDSVPPAGFVPIATVTLPVNPGTVLLMASSAATSTGGATCAPAVAVVGCMVKASCVAAPGSMSNGALVAPPSPVAVADSVYPVPPFTVPVLSMLRPESVATPPTAATVFVPDSVAPAAPVPGVIAAVTFPAKPATVLPSASCAVICTAGVSNAPAVVLVGCTVKTSWLGVPSAMSKGALVAPLIPVAVATRVYPVPLLLRLRVLKLATPPTAGTVVVPDNVPPVGFTPRAIVTLPVKPVATLPWASCAVTCTAGVIATPAAVLLGSTVNTSVVAVPAVILKAVLVPVVSPVPAAVSV